MINLIMMALQDYLEGNVFWIGDVEKGPEIKGRVSFMLAKNEGTRRGLSDWYIGRFRVRLAKTRSIQV